MHMLEVPVGMYVLIDLLIDHRLTVATFWVVSQLHFQQSLQCVLRALGLPKNNGCDNPTLALISVN